MDVPGTVMKLALGSPGRHAALPLTSGSVLGTISPCFVLPGLLSLLRPTQISHKLRPHKGTGELTQMALGPQPSALSPGGITAPPSALLMPLEVEWSSSLIPSGITLPVLLLLLPQTVSQTDSLHPSTISGSAFGDTHRR